MEEINERIEQIKYSVQGDSNVLKEDTTTKRPKTKHHQRKRHITFSENNRYIHKSDQFSKKIKNDLIDDTSKNNNSTSFPSFLDTFSFSSSSSGSDIIDFNEMKEMQQRLQGHLVNLTKILAKNNSARKIQEAFGSNKSREKSQATQKGHQKKKGKNKSVEFANSEQEKIGPSLQNLSDSSSSSSSDSLLGNHPKEVAQKTKNNNCYSKKPNKKSSHQRKKKSPSSSSSDSHLLDFDMDKMPLRPILKRSPPPKQRQTRTETDKTITEDNTNSDLKTADLVSVQTLLEEAKLLREAKTNSSNLDDDRIPGECLIVSSGNDAPVNFTDSDSDNFDVPFIPYQMDNNNKIPQEEIFCSMSSDDGYSNKNNSTPENSNTLKNNNVHFESSTLSPFQCMNTTAEISSLESPISNRTIDFEDNSNVGVFIDLANDSSDQASDEDLLQ